MKLAYFPEQTALQSEPVWRAFLEGCTNLGIVPVENDINADAAVIWSVLWHGRLKTNLPVYKHFRSQNKPVFIIEVGSLNRGKTWKVAVNNITAAGIYGNKSDWISGREQVLEIKLQPAQTVKQNKILIACQHQFSQQWIGNPPVNEWLRQKIDDIRAVTSTPIVVRPHPRFTVQPFKAKDVVFEVPKKLIATYDVFDISYEFDCVVNFNSGVGIQAAIAGTPVIVDQSSLAYGVSTTLDRLSLPDRTQWFQEILHTEWTVEEMAQGIPQERLIKELTL